MKGVPSLDADRGVYLEAHHGNHFFPQAALLRGADRYSDEHMFREIQLSDVHIGLQTPFGTYVIAENDGKVPELVTNRNVTGEWQQFMHLESPAALLPRQQLDAAFKGPAKQEMQVNAASRWRTGSTTCRGGRCGESGLWATATPDHALRILASAEQHSTASRRSDPSRRTSP